jgi:hypothetical protein
VLAFTLFLIIFFQRGFTGTVDYVREQEYGSQHTFLEIVIGRHYKYVDTSYETHWSVLDEEGNRTMVPNSKMKIKIPPPPGAEASLMQRIEAVKYVFFLSFCFGVCFFFEKCFGLASPFLMPKQKASKWVLTF